MESPDPSFVDELNVPQKYAVLVFDVRRASNEARSCLLAYSVCCHAAFITASTSGPAHQLCATRRSLECGTNSTAVESMTSAISVAISLMQVPSGSGGSATTIAFGVWHRRFRSAINCVRSIVFGVSLVLSLFLLFGADLRGMRTFAYTRLRSDSGDSKEGRALTQRINRRLACFVRV